MRDVDALVMAQRAIEKRRLARRSRWLCRRRWSGEAEARWSRGMWDAQVVIARLIKDVEHAQEGQKRGSEDLGGSE